MNLYRHKKTGKTVIVKFGEESLDVRIEATNEAAIIYSELDDEVWWVRPYKEFFDGRFEAVTEITINKTVDVA